MSNRFAIGAKVKIKAIINGNPVWQYREVTAQSGYCSQNSMIAHFGLGSTTNVDSLMVQFPGGLDTVITNISADQQLFVKEGTTTGISSLHPYASISCFPNPTENNFTVVLTLVNAEKVQLRLLNLSGIIVSNKEVDAKAGKNLFEWNSNELDTLSGTYFLEASGKNWKERTKMTIH